MASTQGRLRRLAEELEELGVARTLVTSDVFIEEVDRALRPSIHEGRVSSGGTVVDPLALPSEWERFTDLEITRTSVGDHPLASVRRFADGLSSWLIRRSEGPSEWMVFDRPAGSERDLVILSAAFDATIIQRHPAGTVRVASAMGVLRWDGFNWHHERPVREWIDVVPESWTQGDKQLMADLLQFAVHDLGAQHIGALLIYRPADDPGPAVEERLPAPPPLRIDQPFHLAPIRHALSQIDGAAVFDAAGVLRQLGVRLIPSAEAELTVDALKGTRHTSALRYSYDDPLALVVVVSEDGPVSVLQNGEVLGSSQRGVMPVSDR